ncbi:MAG TPA: LytTR family DNA-binding domain-containing protein [Cytophagales bacterium]|nr:LytTR family DNA-binding domain-containing protein [Cytophagales bacterium]
MNHVKTTLLEYTDILVDTPVHAETTPSINQKIVVMDKQECIFLKVQNICYIEANGAYSNIFLYDGRKMVVSKNVKVFAEKLSDKMFCRTHKSYLINLNFISKYVKSDGGYLIMENGASIPVSSRKRESILQLVEQLSL